MEKNKQTILEYLGVIVLWLAIFGKNAFSLLLFVDYMPANAGNLERTLIASNYTASINVLHFFREIFGLLNLRAIFFSFTILFSMLLSYYYISKTIKDKKRYLFAFIFFFNPFVYTKIMIGQLSILIAYLLIPVFLYYLFNMLETKLERKSVLKLALITTILGAMTPHFFVFYILMVFVGMFCYLDKQQLKKSMKSIGLFLIILLLLNVYWIQGMFAGGMLSEINEKHEDFFAPKQTQGVSAISKVIGMWGFWRENANQTAYSLMPSFLWYLLIGSLVVLVILNYNFSEKDKKSRFYYILFWMGLILGVGISHPYTGKIAEFLFSNVPFFNGFRDSHKFVAFVCLGYAYFLPKTQDILKNKKIIISLLVALLIISVNFQMFNLSGEIQGANYPEEYSELNTFLNSQQVTGKIIFLPWEGYLTYNWSKSVSRDGRVGAFANGIIDRGVVTGPDEYGGNSGFRQEVSQCLSQEDINCLKEIGVDYIIYERCAFYPPTNYSWARTNQVFDRDCLELHKIGGEYNQEVPFRFIISLLISFMALILVLVLLADQKQSRKQE